MFEAADRFPATRIDMTEVRPPKRDWFDRAAHGLMGRGLDLVGRISQKSHRFLAALEVEGRALANISDTDLSCTVSDLRRELARAEVSEEAYIRTFAVAREAASRSVGMRPYDVQMMGARAMLDRRIAEMRTGEGKTLTATLTASFAALRGLPVHVLTVNDYLAARDAEEMGPVYARLGLSVGCIVHGMPPEERQRHYARDVVYATNKEIAFDYLRDLVKVKSVPRRLYRYASRLIDGRGLEENLLLRGLHFAIVDEADSVLLDEARTPLILAVAANEAPEEELVCRQALDIASALAEGNEFTIRRGTRYIELTAAGEWRALELTEGLGARWQGQEQRIRRVHSALYALHLYKRDKDYIVTDGKIIIIDQHTGRAAEDRQWQNGLHQLIQTKEGCELTTPQETQARISYQTFFRKYHHLSGMTGTAEEVRQELWGIYGLRCERIPTHREVCLKWVPPRMLPSLDAKWRMVCDRVKDLHEHGKAVLVGTQSVADSELLSDRLNSLGVAHRVLNARQDSEEAEIVSQAGISGTVTIATSMAGRGTDIKINAPARAAGGLHVILTEYAESARLDRQLAGRAARQGDPGCAEVFFSMEDPLFREGGVWLSRLFAPLSSTPIGPSLVRGAMKWRQIQNERKFGAIRRRLLQADEKDEDTLAVSAASH